MCVIDRFRMYCQSVMLNPLSQETEGKDITKGRRDDANDLTIQVGDRLRMPRAGPASDSSMCVLASVVAVKRDGPTVLVFDDMMWVGHPTKEVEESLMKAEVTKVSEDLDVPSCQRARVFVCPANGAPPDCFFFDERALASEASSSWRWFGRLVPAPPSGTHGQKYSSPRISTTIKVGDCVTLKGRVTRLLPLKRVEPRELLTTSTPFTVLGFVQASLVSQKSYWLLVSSVARDITTNTIYAATMFGKGRECHVSILDEKNEDDMSASTELAIVCKRHV